MHTPEIADFPVTTQATNSYHSKSFSFFVFGCGRWQECASDLIWYGPRCPLPSERRTLGILLAYIVLGRPRRIELADSFAYRVGDYHRPFEMWKCYRYHKRYPTPKSGETLVAISSHLTLSEQIRHTHQSPFHL
jgi:hypothetical protein